MSRYNDTLFVEQPAQQTRNEFGDLVNTEPAQLIKWGKCRDVPSGKGSMLDSSSGTIIAYESTLYLHPSTPDVPVNTLVKVFNSTGAEVLNGKVKRFKRYQHYAKVWI